MLVEVDNATSDGEIIGIGNVVEELQNKSQDLISQATLLDHIHADVQNVLEKLV